MLGILVIKNGRPTYMATGTVTELCMKLLAYNHLREASELAKHPHKEWPYGWSRILKEDAQCLPECGCEQPPSGVFIGYPEPLKPTQSHPNESTSLSNDRSDSIPETTQPRKET